MKDSVLDRSESNELFLLKKPKIRQKKKSSVVSYCLSLQKAPVLILILIILFNDFYITNCQRNDDENLGRHSNRPHRRKHRIKTTRPLSTTEINADIITTTIESPILTDESGKRLSVSDEENPISAKNDSTTKNSVHHIPSPFIYSKETLNQTHADMFKTWLDQKSDELYELSMNYSGYKLLNETYNQEIRQDAQFAWINFTSMIMNISQTVSEVLYNKTLIVKKLSDLVEKTYDEYRNDSDRIEDSAFYLYYDSKSPKTFCDLQEAVRLKNNISSEEELTTTTTEATITTTTIDYQELKFTESSSVIKTNSPLAAQEYLMQLGTTPTIMRNLTDLKFNYKKSVFNFKENEHVIRELTTKQNYLEFDWMDMKITTKAGRTTKSCLNVHPFYKHQFQSYSQNYPVYRRHRAKRQDVDAEIKVTRPNRRRRPGARGKNRTRGGRRRKKTTTPSNTLMYDDNEERTDLDFYDDYFMTNLQEKPFWNITCINRTFDENFKNFPKGVNRNKSTIHVPINVYKQDMNINMTAYWTEALDSQFKKNYDEDNELFWQYFCSSHGLLRRYPGALWTVPHREDFFDCRLQSWYIMAAASPKDVIILMDSSGSMTGLRLEIAKKLIESIMDTLSDNDFFNILTYSNTVNYLMDLKNETEYRGRFIQAGKNNKLRFMEKLKAYKNTHDVANLNDALTASFNLLLNENLESESCKCNKVIMVITDGTSEDTEEVFKKYNWNNGRKVRVFTFLIGRDNVDQRQVQWMACANDGEFFHVATIADVNEHVHEYIPVLSRPMALLGQHETTWSNVFIGHLDKELKIAVARPAFKTKESLLAKSEVKFKRNPIAKSIQTTTMAPSDAYEYEDDEEYYYDDYYYGDYEEPIEIEPPKPKMTMTPEETIKFEELVQESLKEQSVLLGVVGVDVPVLRLISKVSPKFQMGVGIYIIMLDNNGFIVFHPSIKRELSNAAVDSKGTSQSIDIEKFEIPINNTEEFQKLEHEMIDEVTNNITLENWKREGLRVTRRKTEYVYTSVDNSPFSVAIASPNSFGRYYIDLPPSKEPHYTRQINKLVQEGNVYETLISVYNCSYNFTRLTAKITNPSLYSDFCISYLFQDTSQVLAIKSDLVLHDIYYNIFDFKVFEAHPNLVRSSFYGTFSGITFYMPVKFIRIPEVVEPKPKGKKDKIKKKQRTTSTTTTTQKPPTTYNFYGMTHQLSEMTINAELASPHYKWPVSKNQYYSKRPFYDRVFERPVSFNNSRQLLNNNLSNDTYYASQNLFSADSMRHTYSFEKDYYTRSIEFSDYLRNSHNHTDPIAVYFLNDTSDVTALRDTVSATLPIWLDKVPTAVAGVTYDAKILQKLLFENYMLPGCQHESCKNLCSKNRGMNVTCYLVDEHGIVILSTMERLLPRMYKDRETPMGKPLYKVNPWLMKQLEYDGFYQLVIPGPTLQECRKPSTQINNANALTSFISLIFVKIFSILQFFSQQLIYLISMNFVLELSPGNNFLIVPTTAQILRNPTLAERIEIYNNDFRIQNSHCYYFGIYSFNITKWKDLDSSEYRVWCNSTSGQHLGKEPQPRRYLAGYVKHSNLLMLVVEDEFELIHCSNMSTVIRRRTDPPENINGTNGTNSTNWTASSSMDSDLTELEETPNKNKKEIDYSIVKLSDFNTELILGNYANMGENYSNYTNNSDYFGIFDRKPDFHINRYRRRPSHCHSIFLNEKEYLPCSSSVSVIFGETSFVLLTNNFFIFFHYYLMMRF